MMVAPVQLLQPVNHLLRNTPDHLVAIDVEEAQQWQPDGSLSADVASLLDQQHRTPLAGSSDGCHHPSGTAANDQHVSLGQDRYVARRFAYELDRLGVFVVCHRIPPTPSGMRPGHGA